MTASPYVQFYTSDFLAGTSGMTAGTKGVYITLLCLMYEAEAPLAQSWGNLARRCGASNSGFKKAIEELLDEDKITVDDAGIWSAKVEKHLSYRHELTRKNREAAKVRWEKTQQKQQPDDAGALQTQCQPEPEPEPIKEDTNVSSKSSEPKKQKPKKRRSRLPDGWVLPMEWGQYALTKGLAESVVRREAENFADHHRARGSTMLDWQAAWRTWVRNAIRFEEERNASRPRAHSQQTRKPHWEVMAERAEQERKIVQISERMQA